MIVGFIDENKDRFGVEPMCTQHNADAHVTEINAPHLSMISDPGAVAAVIIRAALAS